MVMLLSLVMVLIIATFAWLINPSSSILIDNGSAVVAYENGKFTLEEFGDMTYRQVKERY